MDRLDQAIAAFEDENSDVPFSLRFSDLRSAFMWNAFETIKHIKKHGLKAPISAEAEYIQIEGMKQFRQLEKLYEAEMRAAARIGKGEKDVDKEWITRIRESPSTLGDIVRRTDEGNLMKAM